MPSLGERRKGREIGHTRPTATFEWASCIDCGKERWVALLDIKHGGHLKNKRCLTCSHKRTQPKGADSPCWKGGKYVNGNGYIMVKVQPDNFFFPMSPTVKKGIGGYVMEHRLVMAHHLRRCLHKWEIVHHKNGVKSDNRIENLELTSSIGEHSKQHTDGYKAGYLSGYRDGRERRISELEQRVTLLEAELTVLKAEVPV